MEDKSRKGVEGKAKEKRKLELEAQRARAVASVKLAHAEIEKVEKDRHRPAALSITMRISTLIGHIEGYMNAISNSKDGVAFLNDSIGIYQELAKEYFSVRKDFQEVMNMSDDRFNKLFPSINAFPASIMVAFSKLISIKLQLEQIRDYLLRQIS